MSNKYNEQQDLAWRVDGLTAQPGARKTFRKHLQYFAEWQTAWIEEHKERIAKARKLDAAIYDNIVQYNTLGKRLEAVQNRLKKQSESEAAVRGDLAGQIETLKKKRERVLKKRARLKEEREQLGPVDTSPYDLLRTVPRRSKDEHITGLVKWLFANHSDANLEESQARCLLYAQLSILHDRALAGHAALMPITKDILDQGEVDLTWEAMDGAWENWRPALESTLRRAEADLPTGDKHDDKPSEGGPGPKRRHSDNACKKAWNSYQEFYGECGDYKEVWSKVAQHHGFTTWQAAKQACYRWRKKQNKKRN